MRLRCMAVRVDNLGSFQRDSERVIACVCVCVCVCVCRCSEHELECVSPFAIVCGL